MSPVPKAMLESNLTTASPSFGAYSIHSGQTTTRSPMCKGRKCFFPDIDPVVAVHLAPRRFQRAQGEGAALFELFDIPYNGADVLVGDVDGQKALDEDVSRRAGDVVVHIIPKGALVALQGDDVVIVAHGDAVIGVVPKDIATSSLPSVVVCTVNSINFMDCSSFKSAPRFSPRGARPSP